MIEVELPKDISKVETKLLGMVTAKQALGIVVAAGLTAAMRTAIGPNPYLQDVKSILTLVTAGVPIAFAVFKPYGMSLYAFLVQFIYTSVLSPKKRKYMIENTYENEIEADKRHEEFIIYQYDRIHKIKHRNGKIDKKERPQVKPNKKKSLTGFI